MSGTMSMIFDYILMSEKINDCLYNIPSKYRDDFKQHFYTQLLEMKEDKVITAYFNGYLDWLCIKVITNQYNSNTSSYHRIYRIDPTFQSLEYDSILESDLKLENIDLKKQDEDWSNFKKVEGLLNTRHYYHKQLWYMYYIEQLSYRDIEKQTGINFQSVRNSILKTNEYIKNNLEI